MGENEMMSENKNEQCGEMPAFTPEMAAYFEQTANHRSEVAKFLAEIIDFLDLRAQTHDLSKMEDVEAEKFASVILKLRALEYGSEEYKATLRIIKPAIEHHYKANRHHPEHFENGISGMTLLDLVELLADWKAATLRHDTGDIQKSLEINRERFKIDPQLFSILKNTIQDLKW